jgi:hypothetical protein
MGRSASAIPTTAQDFGSPALHLHGVTVAPGALADITLPKSGMHLVRVQVIGGANSGAYTLLYNGQGVAHFPVNKSGFAEYDVDWVVSGQVIKAGIQGVEGTTPTRVNLVFGETALSGCPPISFYRGIFVASVQAGANATPLALAALTYDEGPAIPRSVFGTTSAGTSAEVLLPGVSGFTESVELVPQGAFAMPSISPAAKLTTPTPSIVLSILNQAAATLNIWLFY